MKTKFEENEVNVINKTKWQRRMRTGLQGTSRPIEGINKGNDGQEETTIVNSMPLKNMPRVKCPGPPTIGP